MALLHGVDPVAFLDGDETEVGIRLAALTRAEEIDAERHKAEMRSLIGGTAVAVGKALGLLK